MRQQSVLLAIDADRDGGGGNRLGPWSPGICKYFFFLLFFFQLGNKFKGIIFLFKILFFSSLGMQNN
jgi:hypothetical protein